VDDLRYPLLCLVLTAALLIGPNSLKHIPRPW